MGSQQLEEMRILHRLQFLDLLRYWKLIKVRAQFRNTGAIRLAWIFLRLIAMFRHRFNKWSFGIAIFVGAVWARQLPIDINHHAGFLRTRPTGIAWKNSFAGRGDDARLPGIEETQRDLHVPLLRL